MAVSVPCPDFEILLLAYSADRQAVQVIDLAMGERIPLWLESALKSANCIKHAYNAMFEWGCLSKYFGVALPAEQWRCTMLTT